MQPASPGRSPEAGRFFPAASSAGRQPTAKTKAASKGTEGGLPARGLDTLLDDLATLTLNEVELPERRDSAVLVAA